MYIRVLVFVFAFINISSSQQHVRVPYITEDKAKTEVENPKPVNYRSPANRINTHVQHVLRLEEQVTFSNRATVNDNVRNRHSARNKADRRSQNVMRKGGK